MVVFVSLGSTILFSQDIRQKASASFDEMDEELSLFFYDALDGKPIAGARFKINGESGVTDMSGKVSLPFAEGFSQMEKTYTGTFAKKGYITSEIPVKVLAGGVFLHRYSISPTLPPNNLRIVLDWGKNPADLDMHLVKERSYHISYRDMRKFEDQAVLDRDDTDGEGPETITINKLDQQAHYRFFVHDFTNREKSSANILGRSHARILVFSDKQLVSSFTVPSGNGIVWNVFSIKAGQIVAESSLGTSPR